MVLVGRRGSDVSATALAELAGKRIALVAGYAYGEAVETTAGPIFVDSQSLEDSVAIVLSGEADYTLMDDLSSSISSATTQKKRERGSRSALHPC